MPGRGYTSYKVSDRWEEAMLCGNGTIGALIKGKPMKEEILLTHEKLYLPIHEPLPPVRTAEHMEEIRTMLQEGAYQKAADYVVELSHQQGYGEKRWTDPFFPACAVWIVTEGEGETEGYEKSLNFVNGLSAVAYSRNGKWHLQRTFVSRADDLCVLHLKDEAPVDLRVELKKAVEDPDAGDPFWQGPSHYAKLGEPSYAWRDGAVSMRVPFLLNGKGYECCMRLLKTDGQIRKTESGYRLEKASDTLLGFSLWPLEERNESRLDAFLKDTQPLAVDFDRLLERHSRIHGELFGRVELELCGGKEREESAEELWEASRSGSIPNAFYEKIFDAGRYLTISACGDWPPNLQGLWTGTYAVPWSSDYTNNGNIQTVAVSLLPGNLAECMQSYFRYLDYLKEDMRTSARALFGYRGIHFPSRSSNHGLNNHFDSTWPMTFWTAGAGWMARFYYDYWLYTQDDDFFVREALPFMKEAAVFYEDFLIEGEDGKYCFTPSYSPENAPSNTGSQACVNATMDIAVARELLNHLIIGCRTLGIEEENVRKWEAMLQKMPPYLINEDGALKEWATPKLEDCYDHRHASHLYPLFYDIAKEFREEPKLCDACRRAYEIKMERKEKEKGVMAFGMVQIGMAASHLGDVRAVEETLSSLAGNHYYPSFSSSHDAGPSIFNADLGGGMPALIMESLVQCQEIADETGHIRSYEIRLLPSLPSFWPKGRIKGLKLRGGFEIDLAWEDGAVKEYRIENPWENEYAVTV